MSRAEKFIQDCTRNCINLAHFEDAKGNVWEENIPWLTPDQARRAVEIAKEEMMEKVCEYLEPKIRAMNMGDQKYTDECIKDLKQAMKDE